MKVGVFENNLPMELEDLGNGYFNLYAPGQIDYKFIEDNLITHPKEGCKYITIYNEEQPDRYEKVIKSWCEKHEKKWFRFDKDGFIFYVVEIQGEECNG